MKIAYSADFGYFGLSDKAMELYNERAGRNVRFDHEIARHDPILIAIVEEFGDEANDGYSVFSIIDIPEGYDYCIDSDSGLEYVRLVLNEDVLRDKIRRGDEDGIVEYVMMIRKWPDVYDDYVVDLGGR